MSDDAELWKAYHAQRKQEAANRRCEAANDFAAAQQLATDFGFELRQCSDTHYQVRVQGGIFNLYPGNQRIYRTGNVGHVTVLVPWSLVDAVRAIGGSSC